MVFMDLGEGLKKVFLAGVGAVATTAETAKEVIDDLVSKGELTMEQGKVLNEELKHNVKKTVKNEQTEAADLLKGMTPEQIAALKEQLARMEEEEDQEEEEASGEE